VRDDNRTLEHPNGLVVDTFYLAESRLAKQILNESVIRSFEAERRRWTGAATVGEEEKECVSWRQQLLDAGVREEDMVEE
jgi:hypothetical protein